MTIENCKLIGHTPIPGEELLLCVDSMDYLDSHCMKNSWSYPADGLSLFRTALKTSVKLFVFLSYPFFFFTALQNFLLLILLIKERFCFTQNVVVPLIYRDGIDDIWGGESWYLASICEQTSHSIASDKYELQHHTKMRCVLCGSRGDFEWMSECPS